MEVERVRRSSVSTGRSDSTSFSSPITVDRAKLTTPPPRNIEKPHPQQQPQQQQQPQTQQLKNRTIKMFKKVQVVYYLTRNGQLEHPHFMEVSHLATQPLRLKDVIDRLTVLRGKAIPCQYSWSCKRRYRNGYVWNDLTENDVIYACEGSEYVLKGSEIIHDHSDFSEVGRLEELQIRKQKKGSYMHKSGLTNKSNGTPQGHNYRQVSTIRHSNENDAVKNYDEHTENQNNDDDDEDEEKGSCNSSNAPYSAMQMEQEESFSLPSTSSTNSDKQPPPPPPQPLVCAESKRLEKQASRVIQEDGDTTISTNLTRNSATLLHLIACGGAGIVGPNKSKSKGKGSDNGSSSNRSLNLRMKNNFMPCLKQQLSSRGAATATTAGMIPPRISKEQRHGHDVDVHHQVVSNDDEDMMMVRYMSENPRFGNLQSEEKEYFSGTIIEAMTTTNQYDDHSQASAFAQPPVLTKSSSYNEHTRSSKGGLHAEAAASKVEDEDDDEKNEDAKVKGMIKLCIPRKKSLSSLSTSANSKHSCY